MAKEFTVRRGRTYRAGIQLAGLQSWASNTMIRRKLEEAGFAHVEVTGKGRERTATAYWPGKDTTAPVPAQVISLTELGRPA